MQRHVASRTPDQTRQPARWQEETRCTQQEVDAFARAKGVARWDRFLAHFATELATQQVALRPAGAWVPYRGKGRHRGYLHRRPTALKRKDSGREKPEPDRHAPAR